MLCREGAHLLFISSGPQRSEIIQREGIFNGDEEGCEAVGRNADEEPQTEEELEKRLEE